MLHTTNLCDIGMCSDWKLTPCGVKARSLWMCVHVGPCDLYTMTRCILIHYVWQTIAELSTRHYMYISPIHTTNWSILFSPGMGCMSGPCITCTMTRYTLIPELGHTLTTRCLVGDMYLQSY